MTEPEPDNLAGRLNRIKERIENACARTGRRPEEVRIMAASKMQPPASIAEAAACGLAVFGENRVQEARQKIPLCPTRLEWHMIGHLQSNKAREAVRLFSAIHSCDSHKILEAVDAAGAAAGRIVPVLLEVNLSGEGSKFGLAPELVPVALEFAGRGGWVAGQSGDGCYDPEAASQLIVAGMPGGDPEYLAGELAMRCAG